mmetsp:Transcript_9792/g.39864  ORF Transcript_9792/g.39864 Transcript_9792/m.39864 type:complete len:217 (-) Transcript_9792:2646-3296(-)
MRSGHVGSPSRSPSFCCQVLRDCVGVLWTRVGDDTHANYHIRPASDRCGASRRGRSEAHPSPRHPNARPRCRPSHHSRHETRSRRAVFRECLKKPQSQDLTQVGARVRHTRCPFLRVCHPILLDAPLASSSPRGLGCGLRTPGRTLLLIASDRPVSPEYGRPVVPRTDTKVPTSHRVAFRKHTKHPILPPCIDTSSDAPLSTTARELRGNCEEGRP